MYVMTVLNIYSLCMLQLSVITLNCHNGNLDSNSDELHDLSLKILFVGNYIQIQIIQNLLFTAYQI